MLAKVPPDLTFSDFNELSVYYAVIHPVGNRMPKKVLALASGY